MRRTFLGVVCVGVVLAAYWLRSVFNPLLIALVVAYILNPVANWLEGKRIRRVLAVILIYVLVLAPCVAGIAFVGTLVWADAKKVPAVLFGDQYEDANGNGIWERGEELSKDLNEDGQYDPGVVDKAYLLLWVSDKMDDRNHNGRFDPAETLTKDTNSDGKYDRDQDDEFEDLNGNGRFDPAETLVTDLDKDGKYDAGELLTKDVNGNGEYDEAEGDEIEDENGNGKLDPGDEFGDLNGNERYDPGDTLVVDIGCDGKYDVGLLRRFLPLVHRETGTTGDPNVAEIIAGFREWMTGKWNKAFGIVTAPIDTIAKTAKDLLLLVVNIVLVGVYVFFFLLEMNVISDTLFKYLPGPTRETTVDVLGQIDHAVSGFFRGRLIVCGIVGTLTAVVMACLQVRFAILLGLLTGVGNLVPFLGVIIGLFPAALLSFVDFHEPLRVGFVVMGFAIVQWLEGMVITPFVMGREVEMHPVTLIVALLIGGQMFGLFGVLIAVPLACILKILAREFVLPELRQLARDRE